MHVVGLATALSGICSYGFLALASRSLTTEDYARLAAAWSFIFIVEPALFAPIAQVLARNLASGRVKNDRLTLSACVRVGVVLLVTVSAGVLLASGLLRDRLFDGDAALFAVVLAAIPAQLLLAIGGGFSVGRMRYTSYGRLYAVDGVVRLCSAVVLAAFGVDASAPYAVALSAGPIIAFACTRRRLRRPAGHEPSRADLMQVFRSIGHQIVSSGLAIGMLSTGPLLVKALADAERRRDAGRFLNATTVSQAPIMVAGALLLVLLPRLSELVMRGRLGDLRRVMTRLLAAHLLVSTLAIFSSVLVGPRIVRIAYGQQYDFPRADFALLVAASALFFGAQLAAQALLAMRREGRVNLAYLAGATAMALVVATTNDLFRRVELGLLVGTATTYVALVLMIVSFTRTVPAGRALAG